MTAYAQYWYQPSTYSSTGTTATNSTLDTYNTLKFIFSNTTSATNCTYNPLAQTTSDDYYRPLTYDYYHPRTYKSELSSVPSRPTPPQQPTPEEIQRRDDEIRRRNEERVTCDKANRKARALLLDNLDTLNRWRILKGEKQIEVKSKLLDGITYVIPYNGRISAYRNGKVVSIMCVILDTREFIPDADKMLAKLLYIQNDERNFINIANHSNKVEDLKGMIAKIPENT